MHLNLLMSFLVGFNEFSCSRGVPGGRRFAPRMVYASTETRRQHAIASL